MSVAASLKLSDAQQAPAPPSPATTSKRTSPTATPSPCTPPRASTPTPPTPCSANRSSLRRRKHRPALLYVALTRGRESNTGYLYERLAGEGEHEHAQPTPGVHVARRGTSRDAAHLVRAIIASHDEQARTAHDIAAETPDREPLPDRVRWALDRRAKAVHAGGWRTGTGMKKPKKCLLSGNGGSSSTSTAARIRASTTALTSDQFLMTSRRGRIA